MTSGRNITAQTYERPAPEPVAAKVPFVFVHINKCGGSSVEIAFGLEKSHLTAAEHREGMGVEAWQAAYTFALVRNPFARVASIYYYRVKTDQGEGGLANRHLSLNAWIERAFVAKDPAYNDGSALLRPAWDWVSAGEESLVEHVFRLEDIRVEWPKVCAKLGVVRHLQRTNHNHYPPYRDVVSAEGRAAIEKAFARDFEKFDYDW